MTDFVPFEGEGTTQIKYRGIRPEDRALIVVHEGLPDVLTYIGPSLDYINDTGVTNDYYVPCCEGLATGVYVFEGKIVVDHSSDPAESDDYLDGTFRPATKEEWQKYLAGDSVWDESLWIEG